MLAPIITDNLPKIKDICQKHHVKELYVFGSASKNELKDTSDVDFLYSIEENVSLETYADNFFDMLWAFEGLFGRKVDMVAEKYLRNRFFIRELNETKQILYKAS